MAATRYFCDVQRLNTIRREVAGAFGGQRADEDGAMEDKGKGKEAKGKRNIAGAEEAASGDSWPLP